MFLNVCSQKWQWSISATRKAAWFIFIREFLLKDFTSQRNLASGLQDCREISVLQRSLVSFTSHYHFTFPVIGEFYCLWWILEPRAQIFLHSNEKHKVETGNNFTQCYENEWWNKVNETNFVKVLYLFAEMSCRYTALPKWPYIVRM